MAANFSIERTCPGKPGHAAHVERWEDVNESFRDPAKLATWCAPAGFTNTFNLFQQA